METAEYLKQVIRDMPYDLLQKNVYICFANGCLLFTGFLKAKGAPGWSAQLVDEMGHPMLSKKEQETVESAFASAPWLLELLSEPQTQRGGAIPSFSSVGSSVVGPTAGNEVKGDDVSLDLAFQRFLEWTTKTDEKASILAYEGIGAPVTSFLSKDIVIPIGGPLGIPIPRKTIYLFIMSLVDMFLLSQALSGKTNVPVSLFVMVEQLVTGQWRQMILTTLGLFTPTGVAIGVVGKYFVNAWLLINPQLRDNIMRDIYKGTKSMFMGFLLWAASVFPPEMVKAKAREMFDRVGKLIPELGEKMKRIEEKASLPLASTGKEFKFTGINSEKLSKFTLSDIQNVQMISQWTDIVCTSDYQKIVEPLEKEPILRLVLELAGVPTTKEDKLTACGPEPYPTLDTKIEKLMELKVVNKSGGGRKGKRKTIL